MSEPSLQSDDHETLMRLSDQARQSEQYATAYQMLVTAIKVAKAREDSDRLWAIAGALDKLQQAIDLHEPTHPLNACKYQPGVGLSIIEVSSFWAVSLARLYERHPALRNIQRRAYATAPSLN